MKTPGDKFLIRLLSSTEDVEKFYELLSEWFEENIEKEPLIFYQPYPLADLYTGEASVAEAKVLRGEIKNSPARQEIEQFSQKHNGLVNKSHELTHLESDSWFGALEYPGAELVFLKERYNPLKLTLQLAQDLFRKNQMAQIGELIQKSQKLEADMGEVTQFLLQQLSELLKTEETGFYVPRGRNFKLRNAHGFSYRDYPKRQTIPGNLIEEGRMNEEKFIKTEEPEEGEVIYFPLVSGIENLGLLAAFEPGLSENMINAKHDYLTTLAELGGLLVQEASFAEQGELKALEDKLTGLRQENYFRERIREEVERGRRYDVPCSLLLLDVDNFSDLNEELGEQVGNAILREIGDLFQTSFRTVDITARLKEDVFALLLTNTPLSGALCVADRLQRLASKPILELGTKEIEINFSGGLAAYPEDGDEAGELLKQARLALYQAKKTGKNKICSTSDLS